MLSFFPSQSQFGSAKKRKCCNLSENRKSKVYRARQSLNTSPACKKTNRLCAKCAMPKINTVHSQTQTLETLQKPVAVRSFGVQCRPINCNKVVSCTPDVKNKCLQTKLHCTTRDYGVQTCKYLERQVAFLKPVKVTSTGVQCQPQTKTRHTETNFCKATFSKRKKKIGPQRL